MPTVDVYNIERTVIGQLELSDGIFGVPVKPHVMHEVVLVPVGQAPGRDCQNQGKKRDRWRRQETVAAKRNRPGPCGNEPFAHLARGWHDPWTAAEVL